MQLPLDGRMAASWHIAHCTGVWGRGILAQDPRANSYDYENVSWDHFNAKQRGLQFVRTHSKGLAFSVWSSNGVWSFCCYIRAWPWPLWSLLPSHLQTSPVSNAIKSNKASHLAPSAGGGTTFREFLQAQFPLWFFRLALFSSEIPRIDCMWMLLQWSAVLMRREYTKA